MIYTFSNGMSPYYGRGFGRRAREQRLAQRTRQGRYAQLALDSVAMSNAPPSLAGGKFSYAGNQMGVIGQLDNYSNLYKVQMEQSIKNNTPFSAINHINLTIAGNKVRTANVLCQICTLLWGILIAIPFFFLCCLWWKNIVHPKYEVNESTYRSIGQFIKKTPEITTLTLVVIDNCFDRAKANILYEILQGGQIKGFYFMNQVLPCNFRGGEADDFIANMTPIKSLPITCNMIWGKMII